MCKNLSSAVDIAQLTGECMKIPLFCKIVGTASHAIQTKYVDDTGEYLYETLLIENTNRLLKSTV